MKGNKPDFHDAADPQTARKIYDYFYNKMSGSYVPEKVKNGVFQAMMEVELKNDGPVGVDYCNEDAAVHFAFLACFLRRSRIRTDLFCSIGHDRDQYQASEEGTQGAQRVR